MTKKYTNALQNHVEDFHKAFNHPTSDKPKSIDLERALNRSVWTAEEIVEFIHASSKNKEEFSHAYYKFKDGLDKAFFKSMNEPTPDTNLNRITAQADALADQLYFMFGTAVELGVDLEPVVDIVQAANMSKLFTDENGNKYAKYREDGKILKSPEFFSPEEKISHEIAVQLLKRK